MPTIPIINKTVDFAELMHSITAKYDALYERLQDEKSQRKLVLVIVAIALLLDNMLYMVIVPIIPPYLEQLEKAEKDALRKHVVTNGTTTPPPEDEDLTYEGEGSAVGILFASKAAIQLLVGPFSGAIIDRIGYDKPMMLGLTIMFFSTAVFACGTSYGVLFFARSLQGVGSAFADTAGLAMIADRFTEENERQKALGIALAFISFGCLVAPPFGGSLYGWFGKELPFLILAFVCLIDGLMLVFVMRPVKAKLKEAGYERPVGTPIWRLFMDPQILVCAGALTMANVSLAFLEPTISMWMEKEMGASSWQVGMIWLPAFVPHVLGVILTVKLANKYPHRQWVYAAIGLLMEGASCLFIPFIDTYYVLIFPLCSICFGVALIDTALLPTLGHLVDLRYVSVYGSIYAIADISYSVAYAIGPVIAGHVVETIGFTALNMIIAFSNFLYAPALLKLRHIYDYKPFEEGNVLMSGNQTEGQQYQSMAEGPKMQYSQLAGQAEEGQQEQQVGAGPPPGPSNLNRTHFGNVNGHVRFDERGQVEQQQPVVPLQPEPGRPPYENAPPRGENPYNPFRQGFDFSYDSTDFSSVTASTISEFPSRFVMAETDMVLPKLPLPPLAQTLERYLAAIQAIVSPSQFQATSALVNEFKADGGVGHRIQKELTSKRDKEDNWAYSWWLDDMYMNVRLPVVINSSPGWTFPKQTFSNQFDMLTYASKFIKGLLEYKDLLDRKAWPVDRATSREKGQPLCMEQYYRFFACYRVPGIEQDHLLSVTGDVSEDQHIVVAKDNQFFKVVVKQNGKWHREGSILAQLESILAAPVDKSGEPVGILTSQRRDVWAAIRQLMLSDARNAESFEEIETSLFMVCLDKPLPISFNAPTGAGDSCRDEVNVAHQMLHGGGTLYNSCNRWFDKTTQFIFTADGSIGLCFEHSALEGIAIVQMMDRLFKKLDGDSSAVRKDERDSIVAKRLSWNLSDKVKSAIKAAVEEMDKALEDVDLMIHRYKGYGKNFPKACKCSPDAFIQVALQVAHYKLHGKLVATYESASTRRFRRGRVDNIRAATMDALRLAQAMIPGSGSSDQEKKKLFDQAIKTQTEIMVQNIMGEGIDIHLLGLREMAKEMGYNDLDIFADPSYKTANHFALSTSQVPTSTDSYVYYAAVVPDGYGASYNPHENEIVFCLSSFKSCPTTSTADFQKSLDFALDEFKALLEKAYKFHHN